MIRNDGRTRSILRGPKMILYRAAMASILLVPSALPAEVFSHEDWTSVLRRFVDERGNVDYEALARDRRVLDRYLARVEDHGPIKRSSALRKP